MEINVKFRQGPLGVEFQAEDREALEAELVEFVKFLKENQDSFDGLGTPRELEDGKNTQTGVTDWANKDPTSEKQGSEVDEKGDRYTDTEEKLAESIRVDVTDLVNIVEVPESEDDRPHIKTWKLEEGAETLGNSRKDRQARTTLMLLFTWMESVNVDGVPLETLKRALSESDIDPARIDTMYSALNGDAEKYIDKPGGRGGKINLNPSGEHQARKELRNLIE